MLNLTNKINYALILFLTALVLYIINSRKC